MNPVDHYKKTVNIHGHHFVSFTCTSPNEEAQYECVSINDICQILNQDRHLHDRVEALVVNFLKAKKIRRFRPQNHQKQSKERLVQLKEIEIHWTAIEKLIHCAATGSWE